MSKRVSTGPGGPGDVGVQAPRAVEPAGAGEPARYETGRGCLGFVLLGLLLIGLVVGAVVLFGDPYGGSV